MGTVLSWVPKVGRRKRAHAFDGRFQAGLQGNAARPLQQFGADGPVLGVFAKKGFEETGEELGAVGVQGQRGLVEGGRLCARRVVVRLQAEGQDGRDQRALRHRLAAMAGHVARHLAAAHGEPDEGRVVCAGLLDHGGQVVGQGVVVIAVPWLCGAAKTAPVVGDHPVSRLGHCHRLVVPAVGRQWPAVDQDHGRSLAPILDVQAGVVGCLDGVHGAAFQAVGKPQCCQPSGQRLSVDEQSWAPGVGQRTDVDGAGWEIAALDGATALSAQQRVSPCSSRHPLWFSPATRSLR